MSETETPAKNKPEDLTAAITNLRERIVREEMLAFCAEPESRRIILARATERLEGLLGKIRKDESGA